MAKFVLACTLASLPFSFGANVQDELALVQAAVAAHEVPPLEKPRAEFDGKAIAARIRAEMEAAIGKATEEGKLNALMGKKDSSLNEMGGESQGATSVGLVRGTQAQALAVDTSYGFIIQRDSAFIEEGSSINFIIEHGCNTTDALGSNNCLIGANDKVHMRINYRLKEPITEGATMNFNFSTRLFGLSSIIAQQLRGWKNDRFVQDLEPVDATCPICGGTCKIEFFGQKFEQVMQPCPLPAGVENTIFDGDLSVPSVSGLKLLRSKYVGNVTLRRADGSVLASASGRVRAGERDLPPCPTIMQYLNKCKN